MVFLIACMVISCDNSDMWRPVRQSGTIVVRQGDASGTNARRRRQWTVLWVEGGTGSAAWGGAGALRSVEGLMARRRRQPIEESDAQQPRIKRTINTIGSGSPSNHSRAAARALPAVAVRSDMRR